MGVLVARFEVEVPADTWIAAVSTTHPDTTFRLLSGVRRGGRAIELGEAITDDHEAVTATVADHPAIVDLDVLEQTDGRVLSKYESTDTTLYDLVSAASLPVEYPVVVRDGRSTIDVTATREEFDRLRTIFEETGRDYELLSLVHTDEGTGLVTGRQREVLEAALRKGYFQVPRGCTLADVAADLDVDKSTASRILRRGATSILRWHLAGNESLGSDPA